MVPKIGGKPPKSSKSSILIGFSIIFTIHFGGFTNRFFWKHPYSHQRHAVCRLMLVDHTNLTGKYLSNALLLAASPQTVADPELTGVEEESSEEVLPSCKCDVVLWGSHSNYESWSKNWCKKRNNVVEFGWFETLVLLLLLMEIWL